MTGHRPLADIRRQILIPMIRSNQGLKPCCGKNKAWFSDILSQLEARYTLPVKREHKKDVTGTVIECPTPAVPVLSSRHR